MNEDHLTKEGWPKGGLMTVLGDMNGCYSAGNHTLSLRAENRLLRKGMKL